ncbi:MAG: hypothetical protein KDI63_17105 [Gammaproteobacteria bacterium]|nr:hypothetical protein [Gammaproteobacteria bacterium]
MDAKPDELEREISQISTQIEMGDIQAGDYATIQVGNRTTIVRDDPESLLQAYYRFYDPAAPFFRCWRLSSSPPGRSSPVSACPMSMFLPAQR